MKERHWGLNMKMMVSTPYLFGFYLCMGMLPSAYSAEADNKMNLSAKAGIAITLTRASK
jgi:hypothetical protein